MILDFQPENLDHMGAQQFMEGISHGIPVPSQVIEQARLWLGVQTEQRLGFYSAQEEEVPVTPGGGLVEAQPGISPKGKQAAAPQKRYGELPAIPCRTKWKAS